MAGRHELILQGRRSTDLYGLPVPAPGSDDAAVIYYDFQRRALMISVDGGSYQELIGIGGEDDASRVTWQSDFLGGVPIYVVGCPLFLTTTNADTNKTPAANTETAVGYISIPRSGACLNSAFACGGTLAASDTNYLTVSVVNVKQNGAGTSAIAAATNANTTKLTGGSGITANTLRTISTTAVDEDRFVCRNDIVKVTVTATGSPAVLDNPFFYMQVNHCEESIRPITNFTVSNPRVRQVTGGEPGHGEILTGLHSSTEAHAAGWSWGDAWCIPPDGYPEISMRVKVPTIGATEVMWWGLASNFSINEDAIVANAWFKCAGSMALVCEVDDNTAPGDLDDQTTGVTLTADTYHWYKISFRRPGFVDYSMDGTVLKSLAVTQANLAALAVMFQPMVAIRKSGGASAVTAYTDKALASWDRV